MDVPISAASGHVMPSVITVYAAVTAPARVHQGRASADVTPGTR